MPAGPWPNKCPAWTRCNVVRTAPLLGVADSAALEDLNLRLMREFWKQSLTYSQHRARVRSGQRPDIHDFCLRVILDARLAPKLRECFRFRGAIAEPLLSWPRALGVFDNVCH